MSEEMCGASSTTICVYQRGHEGLCSYHRDSIMVRQLRADLEAARGERDKFKQAFLEASDKTVQSRATEAELRARVERLEKVAEAVREEHGPGPYWDSECTVCVALDAQEPRT